MLSTGDDALRERLTEYKEGLRDKVLAKAANLLRDR
jgi:phosphoribosylcarboxyaminoimidazole (NCAIR) mutase